MTKPRKPRAENGFAIYERQGIVGWLRGNGRLSAYKTAEYAKADFPYSLARGEPFELRPVRIVEVVPPPRRSGALARHEGGKEKTRARKTKT